jgi:TolB-like protein
MANYRINLVGPFGLFAPDGRRINVTSQKAVALIAIVVASAGGVRARRRLEAMLWGSRPAKQAQDSLRRELSNLRKLLADHGAGELLIIETKRVAIAIDRIEVDIFTLGLSAPDSRARVTGDFLEGLDLIDCEEFEDWLREERERVKGMLELAQLEPTGSVPTTREVFGAEVPTATETLAMRGGPLPPPKPSVAVLPFAVLNPEERAWLGAGLADEISVCLSAYPQLFIVSSAASRTLAEEGYSRVEIASRLGVRYLLEGTILSQGGKLRVAAFLIDGQNGEQFWSETFVGQTDASFSFQAEIAGRITPQIWTKVDRAERQRNLRLIGPVSGDYERYWRANALFRSWEKNAIAEALKLTLELVESDPTCPWSTSLAAYCSSISYLLNHTPDREAMYRRAVQNYQAAMRYGAENVEALGYCVGTLVNIGGDMEMADRIVSSALHLLPAHQPTLFWGGWVDVLRGQAERATERFELALRINPATGALGQTLSGIGFAALQRGKVDDAYRYFAEGHQAAPGFPPTLLGLCISAHLVGRTQEARALAQALVANGGLEIARQMRPIEQRELLLSVLQSYQFDAQG